MDRYFSNSMSSSEDTITYSFTVDKADVEMNSILHDATRSLVAVAIGGTVSMFVPDVVDTPFAPVPDGDVEVVAKEGRRQTKMIGTPAQIGAKARMMRRAAKDTQAECAVKLGYAGSSANLIARAENGSPKATRGIAERIIALYTSKA